MTSNVEVGARPRVRALSPRAHMRGAAKGPGN
jgi:hypothetical protein